MKNLNILTIAMRLGIMVLVVVFAANIINTFWYTELTTHEDYSIDNAKDYQVLLTTDGIYGKDDLPSIDSVKAIGNGTIVNYDGKLWILTARHCFDSLINVNPNYEVDLASVMFGENNADIALVPLNHYKSSPSSFSLENRTNYLQEGEAISYGVFDTDINDKYWVYTKVNGKLKLTLDCWTILLSPEKFARVPGNSGGMLLDGNNKVAGIVESVNINDDSTHTYVFFVPITALNLK